MRIHPGCLCLCIGLWTGCENPHPSLTSVSPNQAYAGQDVSMTLFGDNLVPATILDPGEGRRIATSEGFRIRIGDGTNWLQLGDVAWLSSRRMTARFAGAQAQGVDFGALNVELVDPRGQKAVLPGGFTKLASDQTPPVVTFDSPTPDVPFTSGVFLRGRFTAADVAPGKLSKLDWAYFENDRQVVAFDDSCGILPGLAEASCSFQVKISSALGGGDVVSIVARAYDDADPPNVGQLPLSFVLHALPSIVAVSPQKGGIMGGTDVVITGNHFLPDSKVTFDGVLMFPDGGIFVDENTLSGHAPARANPGVVDVVVHSAIGNSNAVGFAYAVGPVLTAIETYPSDRTQVTVRGKNLANAAIYFGNELASALPLSPLPGQNDTTITGIVPPGLGQTTVWALDPDLGYDKLTFDFTWSTP
jgi:hypothetical protein